MEFSADFLAACRSLASSVGEFASLAVLAVVSYLLVAVRSLTAKLQANLTRSPFVSAPVPRANRGRRARQSSSAPPTASAASPPNSPSQGVPDIGLSQIPPELTQVERFLQSVPEADVLRVGPQAPHLGGRGPNDPNPVGRPAGDATGLPDDRGPDGSRTAGAPGLVLAGNQP